MQPVSSLFPGEIFAKLERTKSSAQQIKGQTQTVGTIINNESTTTEPMP